VVGSEEEKGRRGGGEGEGVMVGGERGVERHSG